MTIASFSKKNYCTQCVCLYSSKLNFSNWKHLYEEYTGVSKFSPTVFIAIIQKVFYRYKTKDVFHRCNR